MVTQEHQGTLDSPTYATRADLQSRIHDFFEPGENFNKPFILHFDLSNIAPCEELEFLRTMRGRFYDLARGVARIILESSSEENNIEGILLNGSALTKPEPKDIDLLILHFMGEDTQEYTRMQSAILKEGEFRSSFKATDILHKLGYRVDEKQSVFNGVYEFLAEEGVIKEDDNFNHEMILDWMLDLRLFDTLLITDPSGFGENARYFEKVIPSLRERTINYTGVPSFYHNVLSSGRLYDPRTDDFTIRFEDRYPGKASLFLPPG